MSFGFSIGDFISVGCIVSDIISCLQTSGSTSEYQELLRELTSLQRALQHVDRLRDPRAGGIKCAALMCRHPLEEFLQRIQKYDKSLGLGQSRGILKNTARKLEWAFGQKEEIRKLRDYLNLHIGSINMLLMSHGLEILEFASERAESDRASFEETVQDTQRAMVKISSDIDAQALMVQENRSMISKLFSIVSSDIAAPIKVLSEMITKVCFSTQQIYHIALDLRASLPRPDTRHTYFQAPVRVEDALGRIFPVPSEYSFDDLEAIIRRRFRQGPGSKEVKAGDYELCNTKNTQQIVSSNGLGLLPGMNMTMAIVLKKSLTNEDYCPMPKCGSSNTLEVSGGGRQCIECSVWFDKSTRKRKREAVSLDDQGTNSPEEIERKIKRGRISRRVSQRKDQEISADIGAFRNVRILSFPSTTLEEGSGIVRGSPNWKRSNPISRPKSEDSVTLSRSSTVCEFNLAHREDSPQTLVETSESIGLESHSNDVKYCICRGDPYGNMIACDNDGCPYEWFHWDCIGIQMEVEGSWLCPHCTSLPPSFTSNHNFRNLKSADRYIIQDGFFYNQTNLDEMEDPEIPTEVPNS